MTKLEKPLVRVVNVNGQEIIVEIVPADAGIAAHIKFRLRGEHSSFRSLYIEGPAAKGGAS